MSRLVALFLILAVSAPSFGAPTDSPKKTHPPVPDNVVCDNKIPHANDEGVKSPHGVPQTTSSPYKITLSQDSVAPGSPIRITISGENEEPIRGLQLRAKCGGKIVGSFTSEQKLEVDLRNCDGVEKSGLLYIDMERRDVPEIILDWTAPPNPCDKVEFYALIMKDGSTFWNQVSTPLSVAAALPQD